MAIFHCPLCGHHLEKVGHVPVVFPVWPNMNRQGLTLACNNCSAVTEIHPEKQTLCEYPGLKLDHLRRAWPGLHFLEYDPLFTPRCPSFLINGES